MRSTLGGSHLWEEVILKGRSTLGGGHPWGDKFELRIVCSFIFHIGWVLIDYKPKFSLDFKAYKML